jgi:hypothetical protein
MTGSDGARLSLQPRTRVTLEVRLSPQSAGPVTQQLRVTSSDPRRQGTTISLAGKARE